MYSWRCFGALPVLYKPVFLSTEFPIPYYKNSACHLGTGTVDSVKNTTCIELYSKNGGRYLKPVISKPAFKVKSFEVDFANISS